MKDKPHSLVTYVLLLTFLVKGLACAHCERVVVGRAQPTHMMYYVRIVWPCASFLSRTLSHSVALVHRLWTGFTAGCSLWWDAGQGTNVFPWLTVEVYTFSQWQGPLKKNNLR